MSNPKPRLLFSIDSLQAGGAEKSILATIGYLANDWEITVVYFYAKHDLKGDFQNAQCTLVYIPLVSGYKFRQGVTALNAIIKERRIDLIVTSLYRSGIMSRIAGRQTKTPVVDTIVNDSYGRAKLDEFKGLHKLKFFAVKYLDKITAGIPVLWISNSAATAKTMQRSLQIDPQKIKVIYRGRDVSQIPEWKAPDDAHGFHFVAAGRLVAQKAFDDLIKAFHIVQQSYENCNLTIYGDGPQMQRLQELVSDLGLTQKVSLSGHLPNIYNHFSEYHCLVVSSHYEGMSGLLIEAHIAGMPIVASNISMNKEASVSENSIRFYEVGDYQALAETMSETIEHFDYSASQKATTRNQAIEKYNLAVVAEQYHSVLVKALSSFKT